jgi:hypothetical protein
MVSLVTGKCGNHNNNHTDRNGRMLEHLRL